MNTHKTCNKCELVLPLDCFSNSAIQKDKYHPDCKNCDNKRHEIRRHTNKNREFIIYPKTKFCAKCKNDLPNTEFYKTKSNLSGLSNYCKLCKRNQNRQLKVQLFESLGGLSCRQCRESEFEFLTIQHKFGGGNKHRKQGNWKSIIKNIIQDPLRSNKYEVLCANCNYLDSIMLLINQSEKSMKQRALYVQRRIAALQIISDTNAPICICCHLDDSRILCIDHKIPWHKSKFGPRSAAALCKEIVEQNISPRDCTEHFQILCFNCNQSKSSHDTCIHNRLVQKQKI